MEEEWVILYAAIHQHHRTPPPTHQQLAQPRQVVVLHRSVYIFDVPTIIQHTDRLGSYRGQAVFFILQLCTQKSWWQRRDGWLLVGQAGWYWGILFIQKVDDFM